MRKPELGFLIGLAVLTAISARADTTATPGAGVNLGDAVVGTTHYPVSTASIQTLTGWTSATGGNTTQNLFASSGNSSGGWPALVLQLNQTTTLTGGAITIEGTFDGSNWVTIPVAQILNPNTFISLPANPYLLQPSINQPFLILTQGYQAARIRLSTVISGTATVTPFVTLLPYNPIEGAINQPTAISQVTPGVTNGVVSLAAPIGGATPDSRIAPATPAGVNIKASPGTVYSIQATTIQATPVYLKIYNAASAPTCGSGTPVLRFMIPAAATAANGAGTNITFTVGTGFTIGIGYCVTGALPDADTTAITANNTLVNIEWN